VPAVPGASLHPGPKKKAVGVIDNSAAVTYLFTDIEGSTQLWEQQPDAMRRALAAHDALCRDAVQAEGGRLVKITGDGIHAVFADPLPAVLAALRIQQALADPAVTDSLGLVVRAGLHLGQDQQRDGDYFGPAVNRAARIMSAAHGGQVLVSQTVAEHLAGRLPEGLALRDLGAVRLRDLGRPERVHQVLHPTLRADFPPLRQLAATPNNLTQQLNSFVDRVAERATLRRMLQQHRLVTLLGPGGIGKSRLSVQLGSEIVADYPDGVWFVELAPITDPRLVPQAVASVLGVKEEAGRPVLEALQRFVADRRLLIILDNCEHLLAASAEVAKRLLQAGAPLRLLASSREPLRMAGEAVCHVPILSVPSPGVPGLPTTLRAMAEHDAVRLFVDRAVAVLPTFELTDANAQAVAEICHQLDGIPLALELAAARIRNLPVQTLAQRLGERFKLLKTSDETVQPRQRTLRALIDWSHDLLTPPERIVFQRLSVFAGGWTLEAAEAVCAGDGVEQDDVLDLLSQLVDKSLVMLDAEDGRYHMLETVRQYAAERLEGAEDAAAVRLAHLKYFLAYVAHSRSIGIGANPEEWLHRLGMEHENFLAAHAAADGPIAEPQLGMQLLSSLRAYWLFRGIPGIGLQLTLDALQRPSSTPRDAARCRSLFDAGQISYFMGQYAEALVWMEGSLDIAKGIANQPRIAMALQMLVSIATALGRFDEASDFGLQAMALAREIGDQREIACAANALAQLYRLRHRSHEAQLLCEEAAEIARSIADKALVIIALLNLAMLAIDRGEQREATQGLTELVDLVAQTQSQMLGMSALDACAGLASLLADWSHAATFYAAAEAFTQVSGLRRDPTDTAFLLPYIERARAAASASEFDAASLLGSSMTIESALAHAKAWLSRDRQVKSR
jgi:predicted ATPase/class 3 adenylate cyclase